MDRRDLLKVLGVTATTVGLSPDQLSALITQGPRRLIGSAFFTAEQREAVAALSEAIIPETDTPGAVEAGVADLERRRKQIDTLSLKVPDLAAYYTGIIQSLLAASNRVRLGAGGDPEATLMEAAELIALAKENAGLERAMGATGLGAGRFTDTVHRRFTDLGAHIDGQARVAEVGNAVELAADKDRHVDTKHLAHLALHI